MADDFIKNDADKIHDGVLNTLMEHCNEPLFPGDERRIFGEAIAFLFTSLISEFNNRCKQRLLKYARGTVLDGAGELSGTVRAESSRAHTTLRFTLSAIRPNNTVVDMGTRVTTEDDIYFITDAPCIIKAGDIFADVKAYAAEGGEQYNGYPVGSIATLVDMVPYVESVSNITESTGGDDGEPYTPEGDDRLRSRIQLAPSQLSTAGSRISYRYYAMGADADIVDVEIDSPSENVVNIYPLLKDGKLPDEDTLKAVEAACSDDSVRPLTDKVTALAPVAENYSIKIHYYCNAEEETSVIAAIEGAGGAIDKYNEWQQSKLGRAINPDQLRKLILSPPNGMPGADRVTVTQPTYREIGSKSIARISGPIKVTHEVI